MIALVDKTGGQAGLATHTSLKFLEVDTIQGFVCASEDT
jgi:hypothetical protein